MPFLYVQLLNSAYMSTFNMQLAFRRLIPTVDRSIKLMYVACYQTCDMHCTLIVCRVTCIMDNTLMRVRNGLYWSNVSARFNWTLSCIYRPILN